MGCTRPRDEFRADKGDHVLYRPYVRKTLGRLADAVRKRTDFFAEYHLIGRAQRLYLVARKAPALQPDDVQSGQSRAVADHHAIGNDVALNAGDAADHRMRADTHELMYRRQSAEERIVADGNVAAKRRVVGHDDVITELAVVRDVGARHEQTLVADLGQHAAALRCLDSW